MFDVSVRRVSVNSRDARSAQALGDKNRATLGHLPYAAWDYYFSNGLALGAFSGDELTGYLLFRVPRNEIRIAHLAIDPRYRGLGVARRLVDTLDQLHGAGRMSIGLSCRRDWEASKVWPRLGFEAAGERTGRGLDKAPLTEWRRPLVREDLFSWTPDTQRVAVLLDTNVFIDLHSSENRLDLLGSPDLEDRVDIVVSPELPNELNRVGDTGGRRRLIELARTAYPMLRGDQATLEEWERKLEPGVVDKLSDNDRSDLCHVAWVALNQVPIVVTGDRNARSRLRLPARRLGGVRICRPEELWHELAELEEEERYSPRSLNETEYEMAAVHRLDDLNRYIDNGAGERRSKFEHRLASLLSCNDSSELLEVRAPESGGVALMGLEYTQDCVRITLLRVVGMKSRTTIARQLLSIARQRALGRGLNCLVWCDSDSRRVLADVLEQAGFVPTGSSGHWLAVTVGGMESRRGVSHILHSLSCSEAQDREALANLDSVLENDFSAEKRFYPLFLWDSCLETWLIPIRGRWATSLFGYPSMLLQRPANLGLSVEHVYYRPRSSGERAPARIVWYCTGKNGQGVFAVSLLESVVEGSPDELYGRFSRLGVYEKSDVVSAAGKNGRVFALRVGHTKMFNRVVSLARMKELSSTHDRTPIVRWPNLMDPELARSIVMEGLNS